MEHKRKAQTGIGLVIFLLLIAVGGYIAYTNNVMGLGTQTYTYDFEEAVFGKDGFTVDENGSLYISNFSFANDITNENETVFLNLSLQNNQEDKTYNFSEVKKYDIIYDFKDMSALQPKTNYSYGIQYGLVVKDNSTFESTVNSTSSYKTSAQSFTDAGLFQQLAIPSSSSLLYGQYIGTDKGSPVTLNTLSMEFSNVDYRESEDNYNISEPIDARKVISIDKENNNVVSKVYMDGMVQQIKFTTLDDVYPNGNYPNPNNLGLSIGVQYDNKADTGEPPVTSINGTTIDVKMKVYE